MTRLAPSTVSNYKVRLRKLRKVLPLMKEDHPERPLVLRQIEKLTNQLGLEMSDLEIELSRGPGRHRSVPKLDEFEDLLRPEVVKAPSVEELEREKAAKLAELRSRVMEDNPDLLEQERRKVELEESERKLVEMSKLANEEVK